MRFILIDFEDSFTYNIAAECHEWGLPVEIWAYQDLGKRKLPQKKVLLWGPGPGHPREYASVLKTLPQLLADPLTFHWGVCLGHQLILAAFGFKVQRCSRPVHGQNFLYSIPSWGHFPREWHRKEVLVQRYNSLAPRWQAQLGAHWAAQGVSFDLLGQEIWSICADRIITYQFHPESVGTSPKTPFFLPLLRLFYNGKYEDETIAYRRNLQPGDVGTLSANAAPGFLL